MLQTVDKPLLYTILILLIGGFLVLTSASMALSQKEFGSPFYLALRQLAFGGSAGIIAFLVALWIPYRAWRKLALPLMILSFIFLALLFIPELSFSFGGARRWLSFGPLTFQPSEILKFSFLIYLASWLEARKKEVTSVSYGLIPFSIMMGIVAVFLVMQPDIGTLGVIVVSAGFLYFLAGGRIAQITTLALLGLAAFYLLVQAAPYRLSRIMVFLNPELDPQGIGYQINQAFIAIGSGGIFGQGFGRSIQKYSYLPEPVGDSIFAIFAEELGFIGVLILIALFAFFFWRGIGIALKAPDTFGVLLAAGISISIMAQAFINMAAISGLLPLTGIPLPFISYGGSSLVMTLTEVGVLLNISKHT